MAKDEYRPMCLLCSAKKARVLPCCNRDGDDYVYAYKSPVFCSQKCAANWALIRAADYLETWHWCKTGEWEACPEPECQKCHPETLTEGEEDNG